MHVSMLEGSAWPCERGAFFSSFSAAVPVCATWSHAQFAGEVNELMTLLRQALAQRESTEKQKEAIMKVIGTASSVSSVLFR